MHIQKTLRNLPRNEFQANQTKELELFENAIDVVIKYDKPSPSFL
jgi:hypothetical protein